MKKENEIKRFDFGDKAPSQPAAEYACMEQQLILQELEECSEWMLDNTMGEMKLGDTLDEAIQELTDNPEYDVYEVVVCLHLANGEVVELRNHCFDCFTNCSKDAFCDLITIRRGSNIDVCGEGFYRLPTIYATFTDDEDNLHHLRIPISQVTYVESYNYDLDWMHLWGELSESDKSLRRKHYLEYWSEHKGARCAKDDK